MNQVINTRIEHFVYSFGRMDFSIYPKWITCKLKYDQTNWCLIQVHVQILVTFFLVKYFHFNVKEDDTLDDIECRSTFFYSYNIVFFVVTYALPMTTMLFFYTKMSFILWGSHGIGERTIFQEETIKSRQKIVPMLITLSTVFSLCWLPYQVYFLVFPFIMPLVGPNIKNIYLAFYWLAMFNSSLNPLIYCLLNKRLV